jgi:hypothetical protein
MASKGHEYQVRQGKLVTTHEELRENLGNRLKAWVFSRRDRGTGKYSIPNEFARQAVIKTRRPS